MWGIDSGDRSEWAAVAVRSRMWREQQKYTYRADDGGTGESSGQGEGKGRKKQSILASRDSRGIIRPLEEEEDEEVNKKLEEEFN
jgi:hypothetical protein